MGILDGLFVPALLHEAAGPNEQGFLVGWVLLEFEGADANQVVDVYLVAVALALCGELLGEEAGVLAGTVTAVVDAAVRLFCSPLGVAQH